MNFIKNINLEILNLKEKDLPLIEGEPKKSLKDCLSSLDELFLKKEYNSICSTSLIKPKKLSKNQIIEFLEIEIPKIFTKFISHNVIYEIDDLVAEKVIKKPNILMISMCFMFGYKSKKGIIYIIPNELKEIYKKETKKNSEPVLDKFWNYLNIYFITNGFLKQENIIEITKRHNINIDAKTVEKELSKSEIKKLCDNYYGYSLSSLSKDLEEIMLNKIKIIIKEKETTSLKFLEEEEILLYNDTICKIINNLNKKLKIKGNTQNPYITNLISEPNKENELIEHIIKEHKLNKKKAKLLSTYIDEIKTEIRYWSLNGRTLKEKEQDELIKKMLISKKPKDNLLKTCIDSLPKEALQNLKNKYNTTRKEELIKSIKEDFKKAIYTLNQIEYYEIKTCQDTELDIKNVTNIENGFLYAYKTKSKNKIMLPKELKLIIDKVDITKLEKEEIDLGF